MVWTADHSLAISSTAGVIYIIKNGKLDVKSNTIGENDTNDEDRTPILPQAALEGQTHAARATIDSGKDIDMQDKHDWYTNVMADILDAGADIDHKADKFNLGESKYLTGKDSFWISSFGDKFIGNGWADGPASIARIGKIGGMSQGPDGCLYVSDIGNNMVRKITLFGEVSSFSGSGQVGYRDGDHDQAQFMCPLGVLWCPHDGCLYVADSGNKCIRKISQAGQVQTVVGLSSLQYEGDSIQDSCSRSHSFEFDCPIKISWSPHENCFYILDRGSAGRLVRRYGGYFGSPRIHYKSDKILKMLVNGEVTIVMENNHLCDLEVGPDGALYVLTEKKILRVDLTTKEISVVVDSFPKFPLESSINNDRTLSFSPEGDLYIAGNAVVDAHPDELSTFGIIRKVTLKSTKPSSEFNNQHLDEEKICSISSLDLESPGFDVLSLNDGPALCTSSERNVARAEYIPPWGKNIPSGFEYFEFDSDDSDGESDFRQQIGGDTFSRDFNSYEDYDVKANETLFEMLERFDAQSLRPLREVKIHPWQLARKVGNVITQIKHFCNNIDWKSYVDSANMCILRKRFDEEFMACSLDLMLWAVQRTEFVQRTELSKRFDCDFLRCNIPSDLSDEIDQTEVSSSFQLTDGTISTHLKNLRDIVHAMIQLRQEESRCRVGCTFMSAKLCEFISEMSTKLNFADVYDIITQKGSLCCDYDGNYCEWTKKERNMNKWTCSMGSYTLLHIAVFKGLPDVVSQILAVVSLQGAHSQCSFSYHLTCDRKIDRKKYPYVNYSKDYPTYTMKSYGSALELGRTLVKLWKECPEVICGVIGLGPLPMSLGRAASIEDCVQLMEANPICAPIIIPSSTSEVCQNSCELFNELFVVSTLAVETRKRAQAQNEMRREYNWQCRRSLAVFRDAVVSRSRCTAQAATSNIKMLPTNGEQDFQEVVGKHGKKSKKAQREKEREKEKTETKGLREQLPTWMRGAEGSLDFINLNAVKVFYNLRFGRHISSYLGESILDLQGSLATYLLQEMNCSNREVALILCALEFLEDSTVNCLASKSIPSMCELFLGSRRGARLLPDTPIAEKLYAAWRNAKLCKDGELHSCCNDEVFQEMVRMPKTTFLAHRGFKSYQESLSKYEKSLCDQNTILDGYIQKFGTNHPLTAHAKEEFDKRQDSYRHQRRMVHLPRSLFHLSHTHTLYKLASVYDGSYGCDICSQSGYGWVYHCEECKFDAHPSCVSSEYVMLKNLDNY